MNQPPRTAGLMLVLIFMLAACNLQNSVTPTVTPTLVATTTTTATFTTPPTVKPSPTRTALLVRAKSQPVNCRFGPGVVFEIMGRVKPDQSTQAVGRTSDNLWLYIQDPSNPGGVCWVVASAVEIIDGEVALLSVVNAPVVSVTHLTVGVNPPKIVVSCSAFPQVFGFVADITTNGPAVVNWRWEVNTGDSTPEQMLIFERAETKTVQEFYRVNGANDYKVKIHVLGPNVMIEEANFFAICTP